MLSHASRYKGNDALNFLCEVKMFFNFLMRNKRKTAVYSPVSGKMISIEDVKDPMFSGKLIGDGVAFTETDDIVRAPADGTVTGVFPSKHAVGMLLDDGVELLVHIGINTVELNGKYFTEIAQKNQKVRVGDPLVRFDSKQIRAAGYDDTVILVITNIDEYASIIKENNSDVFAGEKVLEIKK